MRVYISVDMEGIAGVANWDETGHRGEDYGRFRELMTLEANAAATAALESGADTVVVNDSHGGMRNMIIEKLDPRVELISGSPKPMGMMEGLDESFDAVMFVGYHSMAGSPGVLNHTYTGQVLEYRINGQRLGEIGMNAALAGHYGVPVVFLSGDDCAVIEVEDLIPGVHTACVKQYVGRYAARSVHPERAREMIRSSVKGALAGSAPEPFRVQTPVILTLKFVDTALADGSYLLPGAERVDPLTVQYTAPDYPMAVRAARALMSLGR
ncbi:MAG: M55 family metallopeptidase [Bacillota bacterium]